MKTIRFPIAILFIVIITVAAQAQSVPALVNYQGRLSTPDGSPLATADYQLTFKIYDSTNGTNLIWGPQIFDGTAVQGHGLQIPVVQGYFNVMLGPVDANGTSLANAFDATNRYVEITISNNAPIAPRQQILTVPFAFQAATAATAGTATNFGGSLAGDVTGTQSATVVSTVNGQSAANVASGAVAANAATSANTSNTIVKRDASGNFSAAAITAASLSGNGSAVTNLNASQLASGIIPAAQLPANLQVLNTDNAVNLTNLNASKLANGIVPLAQLPTNIPFVLQAGLASSLVTSLANALCPPGSITAFGGTNIPPGWLLCDGTAVNGGQYPTLFAAISTNWGSGDGGTNNFNLPDLRGLFLRGVNGTRTNFTQFGTNSVDPDVLMRTNGVAGGNIGNNVGSLQLDQLRSHNHGISGDGTPGSPTDTGVFMSCATGNEIIATSIVQNAGGSETRPLNAYVNYIIKY